jgi:hypothetical protein
MVSKDLARSPDAVEKLNEAVSAVLVLCTQDETYNSSCESHGEESKEEEQVGDHGQEINKSSINIDHRQQLCSWCYRVVDHFDLPRQVVAYAMSYFDTFLYRVFSAVRKATAPQLKLVMTSSLHLACKLHLNGQGQAEDLLKVLPFLTQDAYSKNHILKMEMEILRTLTFKVHPPIAARFIEEFVVVISHSKDACLSLSSSSALENLKSCSHFLAELAVASPALTRERQSMVAAAAVITALQIVVTAEHGTFVCSDPFSALGALTPLIEDFDVQRLAFLCRVLRVCLDEQVMVIESMLSSIPNPEETSPRTVMID